MKQIGITLLLLLLGILHPVFAQIPVNMGIKFGGNSSTLITSVDEFFEGGEINHYLIGAFVRLNLDHIYIQPEAYFNTKGGTLTSPIQNYLTGTQIFSYQTIDFPVLLGINIIKKPFFNLRAHAGPVLSYVATEPLIDELSDLDIDEMKDNYIGIQAGVGFDLWFMTVDARVENSFNIFIKNSSYSASNRVYLLSAGFKIF